MASLFEEFEVHRLSDPLFSVGGHPIAFTNAALSMFIAIFLCTIFMVAAMRRQAVVPGRWQLAAEKIYDLVASMVDSGAGPKGRPFLPLVFTIFTFILFGNLLGLVPGTLATTSHVIVNLGIAAILFTVIIITGFVRHGPRFILVFAPPGIPLFLAPIMFCVELLSFSVRPFSLSVRLFGNMLAGHIVLQVFAGFVASLLAAGWLAGLSLLPMIADIAIIAFEIFVAFLQAYIYATLASVYLHDAIEMH